MTDEQFLSETIKLAKKGRRRVSPNPMVGALIVRNGRVVAKGYHRRFGGLHAEAAAIASATEDLRNTTLYVNLEPCTHFGKQPPCVEKILEAGIGRVVVGMSDPNPQVNGRGIRFLREKGLSVDSGILQDKCRNLNEAFIKYITTGYPFITLKIAQTLDGRIAATDGSSKWISGPLARKRVHKFRSDSDAILVGIGTVLADDPQLNVRHVAGPHPRRVVLDSSLRIPLTARMLNDEYSNKTIIFHSSLENVKAEILSKKGVQIFQVARHTNGKLNLNQVCKKLAELGLISVFVEGGSEVFSSFLRSRLVDRLLIFVAPKILGSGRLALSELGISTIDDCITAPNTRFVPVGNDFLATIDFMDERCLPD